MNRPWVPLRAQALFARPQIGALLALDHAVWQVAAAVAMPLDEQERAAWTRAGTPRQWSRAPFELLLRHLAGALPPWLDDPAGWDRTAVVVHRPSRQARIWHIYPSAPRWPQCSCCGEPVPCRAELQDDEITASMAAVERMSRRRAGDCWACVRPITGRQKAVAFPGDNVDFPGGVMAVFHLKASCRGHAAEYELRWLAADPARQRILTWPSCPGWLIVHGDGSSQCQGPDRGPGMSGRGHTHDHRAASACYRAQPEGCPRGCAPEGLPGIRCAPRPARLPSA